MSASLPSPPSAIPRATAEKSADLFPKGRPPPANPLAGSPGIGPEIVFPGKIKRPVRADRAAAFPEGRRHDRLEVMLGVIWSILTLPIRLLAWTVDFLSRLTGLGIGFALMVLGVALGAGPSMVLGIPVFVIGLILTLRSLG